MQLPARNKVIALSEFALVCVFMCGMLAPAVGKMMSIDPTPLLHENRTYASRPALPRSLGDAAAFPSAYEAYANDQFGFRGSLIKAHNYLLVLGLGVSPVEDAAIGRDGWLFGTMHGLLGYQQERPAHPDHIALWGDMLQARHACLAQMGVRHLFVVAPNKHSIYPEFLPDALVPYVERSRYDVLLAYLDEHTDVEYLDLRPVLLEAKKSELVYEMTGTHWNFFGALLASQAVVEHLANWYPALEPIPLERYRIQQIEGPGSDVASFFGMRDWFRDQYVMPNPTWTPEYEQLPLFDDVPEFTDPSPQRQPQRYSAPRGTVNVVMARDSFGVRMVTYLSEYFRSILFYPREDLYVRTSGEFKTDVVITEVVERMLYGSPDGYKTLPSCAPPQ